MSAQLFFLLQRYAQQGELAQGDLFSRGGVVSITCSRRTGCSRR